MNTSEKENYLKSLNDLLLSTNINEIRAKIEKIKFDINNPEPVEKLWRSPYGSWLFQIVVTATLLFCLLELTLIEGQWLDSGKNHKIP